MTDQQIKLKKLIESWIKRSLMTKLLKKVLIAIKKPGLFNFLLLSQTVITAPDKLSKPHVF